jgi:hypothetical protein
MGTKVDQVIAALQSMYDDASDSARDTWPIASVNRWVGQLPETVTDDPESLLLDTAEGTGETDIEMFLAHTASVLAFLRQHPDATPVSEV